MDGCRGREAGCTCCEKGRSYCTSRTSKTLNKIMWGEDGSGAHLVDEAELGGEQRSERRESFVRKVECYNVPAVLRREAEAW